MSKRSGSNWRLKLSFKPRSLTESLDFPSSELLRGDEMGLNSAGSWRFPTYGPDPMGLQRTRKSHPDTDTKGQHAAAACSHVAATGFRSHHCDTAHSAPSPSFLSTGRVETDGTIFNKSQPAQFIRTCHYKCHAAGRGCFCCICHKFHLVTADSSESALESKCGAMEVQDFSLCAIWQGMHFN